METSDRTLAQWLTWMEANHPRDIELGLDRIGTVAERLSLSVAGRTRSDRPRVITVGGTNGKGSCVAVLESILRAQGYRTGAYTSPHLLRYNERVRIGGVAVADTDLCRAFSAVYRALGDTSLTYFEFGTLAALWLFDEQPLDIWLLEVGLGGRLDAVNLVASDVAVVTSVDLDHMDWLGDTREAIGFEKAGIYRCGRPAICAEPAPPASLRAAAQDRGAHWLAVGDAYDFRVAADQWQWAAPGIPGAPQLEQLPLPSLPLPSAAAAITALFALGTALPVAPDSIRQGLRTATLPGRLQRLHYGNVEVILDVGHNPHAARWLAARLAESPAVTHAVFAVMADKEWPLITDVLLSQVSSWYVGDLLGNPRAAPAATVAARLANRGATVHCADDLMAAWRLALATARAGERVLVFGSFWTVAAVLSEVS